jgi:hypothetical protein
LLGREVNPTVYTSSEFDKKRAAKDHFLTQVLAKPRLHLLHLAIPILHIALIRPRRRQKRKMIRTPNPTRRNFRPRRSPMNRLLVALGAVLVVAGLLWPWLKRMHLFHLPGDIVIDRPAFKFFFPITTLLIVSAVFSLIAW